MRLIDADATIKRLKNPTKEEIKKVLREEYDNAPNDEVAAEAILNMYETVISAIKSSPTIESPRPDWTPCAEGLPKDSKMVIITLPYSTETVLAYYSNGSWYNVVNQPISSEIVIAWMPKPAPYNPDRKED